MPADTRFDTQDTRKVVGIAKSIGKKAASGKTRKPYPVR